MDTSIAIQASGLGKSYKLFAKPVDRLKHAVFPARKKYYQEFWALRNVSFCLNVGETLGIIGQNGSGKSTLLQLICGTLNPTEGSVQTQGRIAALLELGSGFNPEFTGIENVNLNATILGLSEAEINEKFEDILSFADIGEFVYQPVKTYSSGMVVRLAFAVIAHSNPSILVVDEALAVGDAIFNRKCMRFINGLREDKTLLFVSHSEAAVASLCQQCLWLDKGKLTMFDTTRTVLGRYRKFCFGGLQPTDQTSSHADAPSQVHQKSSDRSTAASSLEIESASPLIYTDQDKKPCFAGGLPQSLREIVVETSIPENQFGDGSLTIEHFSLVYTNNPDEQVHFVKGGEILDLTFHARCVQPVVRPCIAGFSVSNAIGLDLFGENTIESHDSDACLDLKPGDWLTAKFSFTMPPLKPGNYFIVLCVLSGKPSSYVVHHYLHEAIQFTSIANLDRPINGLFATDVHAITMQKMLYTCQDLPS
jgi:lipopolysaccharide transport system ATP-binding protein